MLGDAGSAEADSALSLDRCEPDPSAISSSASCCFSTISEILDVSGSFLTGDSVEGSMDLG